MINVLLSYYHIEKQKKRWKRCCYFLHKYNHLIDESILDSGAYSFYRQNIKDINPVVHTQKLLKVQKAYPFTWMVQLDKIGNPTVTKENFNYQKKYGFRPVIMGGEGIENIQNDRKKVFIGGISGGLKGKKEVIQIAKKCSNKFKDFHLLGISSIEVLKNIPPCSVDTSSSSLSWVFGNMYLFNGELKFKTKDIEFYRTKKGLSIVKRFCQDYGLLEVWDDFIRYNQKKCRYPVAFRKLHFFSTFLLNFKILRDLKIKVFDVIASEAQLNTCCYFWGLRFISQNHSLKLVE